MAYNKNNYKLHISLHCYICTIPQQKKAIRVYESLFLYDYKKLAYSATYSAAFSSLAASAVGASATAAVAFLRERLVLGAFLAAVSFNIFSL